VWTKWKILHCLSTPDEGLHYLGHSADIDGCSRFAFVLVLVLVSGDDRSCFNLIFYIHTRSCTIHRRFYPQDRKAEDMFL
jgi:hypothetical protein